ncbi:MAG: hypothetical protein VB013_06715 [Anaerolineaceae bacterium]|nr:hypothetical protein [Anaerolineaceae bacterium]
MKKTIRVLTVLIVILLALGACAVPNGHLIIYPSTPPPAEFVASVDASIIKVTPAPYPMSFVMSQEADDLVDAVNESFFPRLAFRRLEKAVKEGRSGFDNPAVYSTMAMYYEDAGDIDKAIEYYTLSLQLYDDDALMHLFRGNLYYQQGEFDLARKDLYKSLSLEMPDLTPFESYRNQMYQLLWEMENH